ncbi:GPO family capsid scaffolding protein [Lysobacter arvi]|uniref:GPO family capsid scaffolding protein n=1 Tax=Lysobacter arvi TaxID=3038776 RepID=A0ABU1CB49_9GAMM|nr:GPO family capsid scaffolding protein [Lysobacter arvi]MDR0182396.1 GPO family capsid scaffolding protein [Lysobacter arvi]
MAKRSKFFRVAVEGATTDGRKIERKWIEQCARNYNPLTYGARVWLEHIRGTLPDSPFRAYGDVVALKAEEVEINGAKKLALFAQIEPTNDLVALNKSKQKLYTSVEIDPSFAATGEAYLFGLGVTDSPASLGTEILAFAAQNPDANPLRDRKQSADTVISAAEGFTLELEEEANEPSLFSTTLAQVRSLLTRKGNADDARFNDLAQVCTELAEYGEELETAHAKTRTEFAAYRTTNDAALKSIQAELAALAEQFSTVERNTPRRPPATGTQPGTTTDC